jgi:glucose-1-phosphate cytidylyltransferase
MKVVILCGGYGTRISSETINKPKPMIKIGKSPILEHIINYYKKFNFDNFIILTGYKASVIKHYFKKKKKNYKIKFIDTGVGTLTGERLFKIKNEFNKNENFMLTYGDGLSNINLNSLLKFHLKHKKIATLSAVRPPARFGEIYFSKDKKRIKTFAEKPQVSTGWINGGFFVFNSKIFKFLSKDQMLERQPIEKLLKTKNLYAYKHNGFWQCLDTLRDKKTLEKLNKLKNIPWS